ncbi:MAG TPA: TIR domain-containing protein [Gemmataceae bacterium]|nr:TIR domain-containing protein [Gemmataceae bacterium]
MLQERIGVCRELGDNETIEACVIDQERIRKAQIGAKVDRIADGAPARRLPEQIAPAPQPLTPKPPDTAPRAGVSDPAAAPAGSTGERSGQETAPEKPAEVPAPRPSQDLWKEWTEPYDLFISYARKDNEGGMISILVDLIEKDFEAFSPSVRLKVFFDKQSILDGQYWENKLKKGLWQSKVMLAVLSEAYFQSEWCQREWEEFIKLDQARIYPGEALTPIFIVAPKELSKNIPSAAREWWEKISKVQGVEMHPFWPKGREALQEQMVRDRMRLLQRNILLRMEHAKALANMPRHMRERNPNFVGRAQELAMIRNQLRQHEMVGICAVNGVAGIGKSTVAREYAYLYRREYLGGQFEIDLKNIDSLTGLLDRLVDIARDDFNADIPRDLPPARKYELAKAAFERREHTVLVILDNLNEESSTLVGKANRAKLPSAEKVHYLITTRAEPDSMGGIKTITLDILPPADALDLLLRYREFARRQDDPDYLGARAGSYPSEELGDLLTVELPPDQEWKAALAIVNRLGRHALATSLVAAYLGVHSEISYVNFARDLATHDIGLALDQAGHDEKVRNLIEHPETLIGELFERSVARLSPLALRTLEYAANLPPDQVPLDFLKQLVTQDQEMAEALRPKPFHPPPLEETLGTLAGLQYLVGKPYAHMHRVLQEVVRRRMAQTEQDRVLTALRSQFAAAVSEFDPAKPGARQGAQAVISVGIQLQDPNSLKLVLPSLLREGRISVAVGDSDQALRDFHRAEVKAKEAGDHKQLAIALFEQGKICDQAKDRDRAFSLYQQAETIFRTLDESDYFQLCLTYRANIHFDRGEWDQALPLYQEAEKIALQQIAVNPGFRERLRICLYNQTLVHKARGEFDQALALLERQGQLCRDMGQVERLALTMEEQGGIHYARSQFDAALERFQAQEQLCRQLNLKDKSPLLRALSNQAQVLRRKGDLSGALSLFEQHETFCRQQLDSRPVQDDATAIPLWQALQGNLHSRADIHFARGELGAALALLEQQEKICREKNLSDGLQRGLGGQAVIYRQQSNFERALELLSEQEIICRKTKNRAGLQFCLHQQAETMLARGDFPAAEKLLTEEEDLCRELKLWDALQACLNSQARGYNVLLNNSEKALALFREQERVCKQHDLKQGLEWSLRNQAALLFGRGQLDEALGKYQEQEAICRQHGLKSGLQWALDGQILIAHNRQQWDAVLSRAEELEALCRELKADAGLHRLFYFQAGAHRGRGELDCALQLFRRLEGLQLADPKLHAAALAEYAALLQHLGNLQRSLEIHDRAVETTRSLNDPVALAWRLLNFASVAKALGKNSEADAAFTEADQLFAEREQIAREQRNATATANFLHARGEVARIREQWDAAFQHYSAALEQDPVNLPFTYQMRGQIRAKKGDYTAASADYSLGIELARKAGLPFANVLIDRAWALFEAERDHEARADFQSAAQAHPNSADVLVNFGNFLMNIGCYDEALTLVNRAVALAPNWSSAFESRSLVHCYLRNFAAAVVDATRTIELNDTVGNNYDLRAWIRVRRGTDEWEAVVADCDSAIALDPAHAYVFSNLALARRRLGLTARATEALHRLLDIHLGNPPDKAGRLRTSSIGWSAVTEDWSAAIAEQPDGMAYLGRGIAQWMAGKIDAAIADLEQALALGLANRADAEQVLAAAKKEKQAAKPPK